MLSQKHTTKMIAATAVITISALGGAVSAQQNVVSTQQNVISAQPNNVTTQQYQFPPADALQQDQTPSSTDTRAAPAANAQAHSKHYPMPYPAQKKAPVASNTRIYGNGNGNPRPAMPSNRRPAATPPPYGRPYNNRPFYRNPGYANPGYGRPPAYGYNSPYGNNPYGAAPYGNPYNRGPYNNFNPYNRGPNNSPFNNFGGSPFSGNGAPWEKWPFGARDSFWNRKEMPFKNQNPSDWFQPGDPKEGAAVMWDDLIAAPDDLGTMPGGWNVPSISVPNPVDLEDQLEKASKEVPDLIRVYND